MSNKLDTKNIKTGGGIQKVLQPGTQLCKINNVELEEFTFKPGAYHLVLQMEGPDLGKDFEGFFINKDNHGMGKYKGQVGKVKASEWAFSDGETKSKVKISRDANILTFMKQLCSATGDISWLDSQDNKHETIESLIKAFNQDKPFAGKFLNVCVAGKEYTNREGYKAYELFLPKFTKQGIPFELADTNPSKVYKFDEATHIKRKDSITVSDVNKFGHTPGDPGISSDTFNLD